MAAFSPGPFRTARPLRFGDCDPSGIAYFPAYLDMLVGVTEDLFAAAGFAWPVLMRDHGLSTPTVRLDVTFVAPGMQGDRLDFTCRVAAIGRSSLDLAHAVATAGRPLWRAEQRLVATALDDRRSRPWPDAVRAALAAFGENDDA